MKPLDASKLNKLPRWARDRIELLEMRLAEAHERERQVVEGDTNVWRSYLMEQFPLPNDSTVVFALDGEAAVEVHVRETTDGDRVELYVTGGRMGIEPRSGNVLWINRIER